MYKVSDR